MADRQKWTWAGAALLVAVLAAAAWWTTAGRDRGASGPPVPSAVPATAGAGHAGEGTPSRPPGDAVPTGAAAVEAGPLPPVDTPFRASIEELQRRARAGEPAAMCRLAAEHAKCKSIRDELDSASWMMQAQEMYMARSDGDASRRSARLERTAARTDEIIEASRHCDGVPEVDDRELFRQWRAAARAGSVAAMGHYATGQAFPAERLLDLLPELAIYRQEAEAMAWRAAEAGDPMVLLLLGMAHMPEGSPRMPSLLGQVVEPDPVEAVALLRLAQAMSDQRGDRFMGMYVDRMEADMDAAQRGAVRERMAALQRTLPARGPAYDERARRGDRNALAEACSVPPPGRG